MFGTAHAIPVCNEADTIGEVIATRVAIFFTVGFPTVR